MTLNLPNFFLYSIMASDKKYPVLQITEDDVLEREQLGTKTKFWVTLGEEEETQEWLFKIPRKNTGEHWAEKVAYEVACLLKLSCAEIELARFENTFGSCSKSFINKEKKPELIHGNEILAGRVLGYEKDKKYGQRDHTLQNILEAIRKTGKKAEPQKALKHFAGYMILDSLIGNTDRHHENWAFLRWTDGDKQTHHVIAPTFDHASSLGRELLDDDREFKLLENRIEQYIKKGRGAIFLTPEDKKGLNPFELVKLAAKEIPEALDYWLEQVKKVEEDEFDAILTRVPDSFITEPARQFALKMLKVNLEKLKQLVL